MEGDTRQGRWGSRHTVGIRVLARPPYRGMGGHRRASARQSDAQLRRSPGPALLRTEAEPRDWGRELRGFATDCPNAILVRVCGQPRIVAGHLWLSSGRNRGGSRRDRAQAGETPRSGGGRLAPAPGSRPRPGAQRRDAGPRRQRRHPHPRRRRRPPSPPPLRVTSPAGGVLQSIALFSLFFKFRLGTKLAHGGGAECGPGCPPSGRAAGSRGRKMPAECARYLVLNWFSPVPHQSPPNKKSLNRP